LDDQRTAESCRTRNPTLPGNSIDPTALAMRGRAFKKEELASASMKRVRAA
jgi:hypothetical protein